mgnify:CR=1 FL=1
MRMEMIRLEHVTKSFGRYKALDDVSIVVEEGEFLTVIGRSGCGKTTMLRMINGLQKPDSGKVYAAGEDVGEADLIRLRRKIGYVIQNKGLFPHMTVEKNIIYVPVISGQKDKRQNRKLAEELIGLVGLEREMLDRYPEELSGGQQQRVGIARALASRPKLLLMDEPFGALDEITKRAMQNELLALQKKLGMTVVFITHDIREAMKLGDRVLVMEQGKIAQCDTPENILKNPSNDYIRNFIGENRLWHNPEFIRVKDIMRKRPFTISRERTILQAMQIMRQNNIDSLLVTGEKNRFLGMIWMDSLKNVTDYDKSVSNYISDDYLSVREEDSFRNVLSMLKIRNYGHHFGIIPVLGEEREIRGYLTKSSLLAVLSRQFIPEQSELEGGVAS